ncbi:MAG TPA: alpha/beta hydrolase, partial [Acholeplasmataceae bacterium]|nr:alpha/beta hydrolase [Acholeplasmataceae bacterium]
LIVHGGADKVVPVEFSKRLMEIIPHSDKKLIIYPESFHEIFNDFDREKAFADVIEWLNEKTQ